MNVCRITNIIVTMPVTSPMKVDTTERPNEGVSPKKLKLDDSDRLLVAKLSENATIPTRGSARAAGYDLYSAEVRLYAEFYFSHFSIQLERGDCVSSKIHGHWSDHILLSPDNASTPFLPAFPTSVNYQPV